MQRLSSALSDRYRIERELGQGGMATVYLAEDLRHKRKVAVKVLRPELAAVLGADRFVQEITTTAALQHPHILPLFDSGTADGFLYYVMPFIDGETLRSKLDRETQLGIDEAVRIASQVADALDYAHRHGVIHRDIKPENILLHDGRPMVADFGIALAVSAAAGGRMTETGLSLGTPHYMSPEQATAEKAITARSDVYSLGSVLYEMLAGQPPHLGGSAQQIIMKIIAEEAREVTAIRKAVPANVAAAVAKSLEKLPADRFESARAFADALANTHFTSTTVRPVVAGRGPGWLLAGAIAAVAVLAFGTGWVTKHAPVAGATSSPIYRFNVDEPAGFSVPVGFPTILPDGSGFMLIADGAQGHGIVVQSFAGSAPRFYSAPAAAIGTYVSRDRSGIYYYAFPGGTASQIQLLPFSGAPPRVVTDSLRFGLALDARGGIYATHLNIPGLTRMDRDGRVEVLTHPDTAAGEVAHRFPAMLSDERGLVFEITPRDGPRHLAFFDLRRRQIHRSVEGNSANMLPNGYIVFARENTLYAGRMDPSRFDFAGAPVPVLRGVSGYSVSETGALLYRPQAAAPWSLRVSGASPRALVSADGQRVGGLRLAPGGGELLTVEGSRGVWVRSGDGGARRLTLPEKLHQLGGWSRDGRQILLVQQDGDFSLVYPSIRHGSMIVVPADGTGAPVMVGRGTGDSVREADWGRNGIAYATLDGTIWWLGDDQSRPVVVGHSQRGTGRSSWAAPAVSPDGRFVSFRDSNSIVVVAAVPPGNGYWEVGPGLSSRWSRDGRYLYFDQLLAPYSVTPLPILRVPVRPGAAFSFGKSEVAARPPADAISLWDLGPDNTVYWLTQAQSMRSTLVVNWAYEVDSLVRAARGGAP